MLDLLDTAHPILTLTLAVVSLDALWIIHNLQQRLRVAESRIESLEREHRTMDEELEMLGHHRPEAEHGADPQPKPLLDHLSARRPPDPGAGATP